MKVDTIIKLTNNSKYLLLDETLIENKKYFYAVKIGNDSLSVTKEYIFIEEIQKNGKLFVKKVEDKTTNEFLLTVFTKNYTDYVERLELGEEKF